ncbi:MAG: hypothetical protein KF904_01790 [Rhodoblastus sp.]|nr:hypothetical protein [Rhodoblastus sp.]
MNSSHSDAVSIALNSFTVEQALCWLVTYDIQVVSSLRKPPVPIPISGSAPNLRKGETLIVDVSYNAATTGSIKREQSVARSREDGKWIAALPSDAVSAIAEGVALVSFRDTADRQGSLDRCSIDPIEPSLIYNGDVALPRSRWHRFDLSDEPLDFVKEMAPLSAACAAGKVNATGVRMTGPYESDLEVEDAAKRMIGTVSREPIPIDAWTYCKLYEPDYVAYDEIRGVHLARLIDFYRGQPSHRVYTQNGMKVDQAESHLLLQYFARNAEQYPVWTDVRFPSASVMAHFNRPARSPEAVLRRAQNDLPHLVPFYEREGRELLQGVGLSLGNEELRLLLTTDRTARRRGRPIGSASETEGRQKTIAQYIANGYRLPR